MKPVLLIDFGSTYTKVTAVDVDAPRLLGTANSYTTVETDINNGLADALRKLEAQTGKLDFCARYACSSAAGGLRMLASGLVPELTAEAAKTASLGAGAKVLKTYSFKLNEDDADEIKELNPDIFLLVGGTDGGNTETIIHNAKVIADIGGNYPVILAGNRNAARTCAKILEGREVHITENVMPSFNVLNTEPVQKEIREVFLNRIIQAKGLSKAAELINGIMMPTPSAVMAAIKLLAEGTENQKGIGDLVAVDVGGATTDVYSVAEGLPDDPRTALRGIPEPYVKRTVEGDIGMRYSIRGIIEAAGLKKTAQIAELSEERLSEIVDLFATHTDMLPFDDETQRADEALASMAVRVAMTRHAGRLSEIFGLGGLQLIQTGKNLLNVDQFIVTGGSLIHTEHTGRIVSYGFFDEEDPGSLKPRHCTVLVDRSYIIAAMGLLSQYYPEAALSILKEELVKDDGTK